MDNMVETKYSYIREEFQHYISMIAAVYGSGYSVEQWLIENNYNDITVYSDADCWQYAETVLVSLTHAPRLRIRRCVSEKGYERLFSISKCLGKFKSQEYMGEELTRNDVVISLTDRTQLELQSIFGQLPEIFTFKRLLNEVSEALFYKRPYDYLQSRFPGAAVITTNYGVFPKTSLSENEKVIITENIKMPDVIAGLKSGKIIGNAYDESGYSAEDLLEMWQEPCSYINENGIRVFEDISGKYLNICDGRRVTAYQPENPKHTVWLIGGCQTFGIGLPDYGTAASHLQRMLNEKYPNMGYCVENYGYFAVGRREYIHSILLSLPVKNGDIIVSVWQPLRDPDIDLENVFQRPHNFGEIWADKDHLTENGNKIIAERIFKYMEEHNFSFAPRKISDHYYSHMYGFPDLSAEGNNSSTIADTYTKELSKYKKMLSDIRNKAFGRIGAIVMNCNPFTLGHRYLIEKAAAQVNRLFVFVVEEDKSDFPFDERYELVKKNTSGLENVTVIPSGRFIISSLTFKDYFNKTEIQDRSVDPSEDIHIFAEHIAPALNINVRFVGEEPFDRITQQYNDTMRKILPNYGIDVCVVKRKEKDGTPISASRVRSLFYADKLDELEGLVPKATFEYLRKCKKDIFYLGKVCTGCEACFNVCPENAIRMEENADGFIFPKRTDSCIKCGLCNKACPQLESPAGYSGYSERYAVWADIKTRRISSSGGFFSVAARYILGGGGVVFGARMSDDCMSVIHCGITSENELLPLVQSKYVQSNIGTCFRQVKECLKNNKKVLFVGTPCQAAGLRSYLKKDYENLFIMDFVCFSVTSPKAWRQFIGEVSRGRTPKNVFFRNRPEPYGWDMKHLLLQVNFTDGTQHYEEKHNTWWRSFHTRVNCRESCLECRYRGQSRVSDITMGDFWGVSSSNSQLDDKNGTSMVLINSEKGKKIFEHLRSAFDMAELVPLKENRKIDSMKVFPSEPREVFFRNIDKGFRQALEAAADEITDFGFEINEKSERI